ncbi:MAG: hypothetical protein J1F05_02940 [Muribaculaceae bacterium]|nr:hypothetical protein [Muribaculaceae bacterium]
MKNITLELYIVSDSKEIILHQKIIILIQKLTIMHYNPILPSITEFSKENLDLMRIAQFLNQCRKFVCRHQQHPFDNLCKDDMNFMSKFIKDASAQNGVTKGIALSRDYLLNKDCKIVALGAQLTQTLRKICRQVDSIGVKKIKKQRADNGMARRYRHLSKTLKREKIKKTNQLLQYADVASGTASENFLIRRIVEKRSAQVVNRHYKSSRREIVRYHEKRAKSFNMYNLNFAKYNIEERYLNTHWKVIRNYGNDGIIFKSKRSYNSLEEATSASKDYMAKHPEDCVPMSPYQCRFCGKWHIGHDRLYYDDDTNLQIG